MFTGVPVPGPESKAPGRSPAPFGQGADVCEEPCRHPRALAQVRAAQVGALVGDAEYAGLAELFRALADLTRVRILAALAVAELCVCDLAELTAMSPSAVSHQLRLLRAARLVRHRKEGKNVFYALDDDHVRHLLAEGLDHVREP
jgi:ArsR family transcriptional regulator, lead/cadmium/zinc/bismuth-responsive transcriptional repressor